MIAAALDLHLQLEESVLLPALAALPSVDPSLLATDLRAYLAGEQVEEPTVIDVRKIARGGRHPRVFARYRRPGAWGGVRSGQQSRSHAAAPGVRSHPFRRVQLGLSADRA